MCLFLIPHNILKQVGGVTFLFSCHFNMKKLPLKWCQFDQQLLLAWKWCSVQNFSPHQTIMWNNQYMTIKKTSIDLQSWMIERWFFWKICTTTVGIYWVVRISSQSNHSQFPLRNKALWVRLYPQIFSSSWKVKVDLMRQLKWDLSGISKREKHQEEHLCGTLYFQRNNGKTLCFCSTHFVLRTKWKRFMLKCCSQ